MHHIKFGSNLRTNKGQMEKHLQGDYDANCEKVYRAATSEKQFLLLDNFNVVEYAQTLWQCTTGDIRTPESESWLCHMHASQLTSRSFGFLIYELGMIKSSLPLPQGDAAEIKWDSKMDTHNKVQTRKVITAMLYLTSRE